jgi:2-oxoglutarate dehydrogenase E1 component
MQGQLDEIVTLLKSGGGARSVGSSGQSSTEAVKLSDLLAAYETIGHLVADIDPLNLQKEYKDIDTFSQKFRFPAQQLYRLLDYRTYGFTEADLEREFTVELSHKSSIIEQKKVWKLKDIIAAYKQAYCGKIGVEFSHIPETDVCDWIRTRFEGIQFYRMTDKEKVHLYDRLNWAHHYGTFLTQKFNTEKRFGLEGCDSFIPGLKVAIDACAENGASHFVIGMPHRGRLNVLINVVRKPLEVVFAELQGIKPTKSEEFAHKFADTGDVKYHLGTTYKRRQTLTDGT